MTDCSDCDLLDHKLKISFFIHTTHSPSRSPLSLSSRRTMLSALLTTRHCPSRVKLTHVTASETHDIPIQHFSLHTVYRVSQEEYARLRESVPYVKVYRYNPKHLYPKLNGYGDNGQRKVGASCGSKYCNLHS